MAHRSTQSQTAELVARIKAAPEQFVAQELVKRSTAPVWESSAALAGARGAADVCGGGRQTATR